MALKPFYNKKYHLGMDPKAVKDSLAASPLLLHLDQYGGLEESLTFAEIKAAMKAGKNIVFYNNYTYGGSEYAKLFIANTLTISSATVGIFNFTSGSDSYFFETSNGGETWTMGH